MAGILNRRFLGCMSFLVLVIGFLLFMAFFDPMPIGGKQLDKLNDLQTKALEITLEMNKLVLSIAVLTFSGIGILTTGKDALAKKLDGVRQLLLSVSISMAAFSIFFTYLIYDKLVEMLAAEYLDLNSDLYLLPRYFQVGTVVLSVTALGLFFMYSLTAKQE